MKRTLLAAVVLALGHAVSMAQPAGIDWVKQVRNKPMYDVRTYNFRAISPGTALTGGVAASLTVPCWLGIVTSGTYASQIYLSGGTGTAESKPLTGGTCTSGALSGTIQFTPTNSHSGAYTIISSTGGLQECLNDLSSGTGSCGFSPQASVTVHATTTAPVGRSVIDGGNINGFQVVRGADFTTGPMILVPNGAVLTAQNLGLTNTGGTADAAIKQVAGSSLTFSNSQVSGGAYCIEDDSGNGTTLAGAWACYNPTSRGLWFHSTTGTMAQNVSITGGYIFPTAAGNGELLGGVDDFEQTGTVFGGGNIGVVINPDASPNFVNGIYLSNLTLDNQGTSCMAFGGGTNGSANGIHVVGGRCHGNGNVAHQNGIDVGASSAVNLTDLTIIGMQIVGWAQAGVLQAGTGIAHVLYASNEIYDNNVGNVANRDAGIVLQGSVTDTAIVGNLIKSLGVYTGHQNFGVKTLGATTRITIVGNDLSTNATAGISLANAVSGGTISDNTGVTDVAGTVADAATIALPVNRQFTITGSGTGVTAVTANMPANSQGTVITTGGAIAFTAGASIGASCTTTQNKLYNWLWDGTKFWLNGPGC